MRYRDGRQGGESDVMSPGLSDTKNQPFTRELSFFLLTLVGFAAMLAMLCVAA